MTRRRHILRLIPLLIVVLPLGGVLALAKANINQIQKFETITSPSANVLGETEAALILVRQRALLAAAAQAPQPVAVEPEPAKVEAGSQEASPLPVLLARGERLLIGVETRNGPYRMGQAQRFQRQIQRPVDLVQYSRSFAHGFDPFLTDRIVKNGSLPVFTWEPWLPGRGLAGIAEGRYDAYLTKVARSVRDYGHPILLRFGPEMNGDWNPWSEQTNGHRPGDFARAWRHVHHLFASVGASNVVWVWCPNVEYPGSTPLRGLYPGDEYVDVVGLDGYNWGSVNSWNTWKSFDEVFGPTLDKVRRFAPDKPLIISETGSAESGGDKGDWIRDAFAAIANKPRYRGVVGLVWYDQNKETDWRISSSPRALQAFRGAADLPRNAAARKMRQLLAAREGKPAQNSRAPNRGAR